MKHLFLLLLGSFMVFSGYKDKVDLESDIETRGTTDFNVTIECLAPAEGLATPFTPGIFVVKKKNSNPLFEFDAADYGEGWKI